MCLSTAGRVTDIEDRGGVLVATVRFEDRPTQLCLSYLPDLTVGEHVLVAGGAILERVDEAEALERASFAQILLDAFDATAPTKSPGGRQR